MQHFRPGRLAVLLCPVVLAAGCASGPPQPPYSALELGSRLEAGLAPAMANGSVVLEQLPDGARVTLTDQALFPPGSAALDGRGRYLLASVMEGLLAPPRLLIDVTASPGTPATLQQARASAVTQFLREYDVAPDLQYASLRQDTASTPGATVSPGVAITVIVTPPQSG